MAEEVVDISEEIADASEDAGAEDEFDEDVTEEEKQEMEEEKEEAKKSIEKLKKYVPKLKELGGKLFENIKEFGKFFAKCSAMAAIMYGVNVLLSKVIKGKGSSSSEKESAKKKKEVVTNLNALLTKEATLGTNITDWLVAHKDTQITVDDMTIPLISIFQVYVDAIKSASAEVQELFGKLIVTGDDGKKKFAIPTAGDVSKVLDVSETYLKTFNDIRDLIQKKMKEFPVLESLNEVVTQAAINDIRDELGVVRKMPYE